MSDRAILTLGTMMSVLPFTGVSTAHGQVVIETVHVGNPGNAGELCGQGPGGVDLICGAVDYVYRIGRFEVTAGQYTEFLNAVAATDTYDLYTTEMWTGDYWGNYGCKIQRSGAEGSYSYSVAADWANRPVTYVSWGNAARFCNWLHNGQPRGSQDLSTTEDGSYYLNGATSDEELMAVVRQWDATWVIPSEDEWYKAAYHKNDGVTGNYFLYPTGSDSVPVCECCPGGGNSANYDCNGDGPGGWACGPPYYTNSVGCYIFSQSPYGSFDQGGNVWERTEAVTSHSFRVLRGGSFAYDAADLRAGGVGRAGLPTAKSYSTGFRVARVSDPVCALTDTDADGDSDLGDFALFQNGFSDGDLAEYAFFQDCLDGPVQ